MQFSEEDLSKLDKDSLGMLGDWVHKVSDLEKLYSGHKDYPFPYVVIDNFLNENVAENVEKLFPLANDTIWHKYHNPLEKKLACNNLNILDKSIKDLIIALNTPSVIDKIQKISGIPDLEPDPLLHGGGIHCHPRGGKLDMHLDYSVHPLREGKERRLNLILYLNKDWKEEYGGEVQLWDKELKSCVAKVVPIFNRAVLFQTSDMSYHGLPDPIKCPETISRKSVANYYLSPIRPNATPRLKAQFFARPTDPPSALLDNLRQIRIHRRIEASDLPENWETEFNML
eukprot:TRINITY_DN1425_c0_g1_i6.p1 TRINITY_DN1425_c0_g1~~TRINITY_DN1425_c0_g1_i6.p1  ORF type:complete len:285 (-),score=16.46 TRINITY_DN1425_c0_g1_i6:506-1360(-)